MATLLLHVNNTLALLGEQPLLNTTGNLGDLAKRSLQAALYKLVAETRHTSFLSQTSFNVTNTDHTLPAFALPDRCIQIKNVYWKSTYSTPYSIVKLVPSTFDRLSVNFCYAVVGNSVFVGYRLARPFTAVLEAYVAPSLSGLADSAVVVVPEEAEIALEVVAASLMAASYIDDLATANTLAKRAEVEIEQLRRRAGAARAPLSWRR